MKLTSTTVMIAILSAATAEAQVTSFNTRTGAVTLQSNDATGAFGYTPALTFQNQAALIAYNPSTFGVTPVTATTAGYTTAGDGGAATYDWNPTSTAVDTYNIFVIQPTGVSTGRWFLRTTGNYIYPQQAGVTCDGVNDASQGLTHLATDIGTQTLPAYIGIRILLTPNTFCLLNHDWTTPTGVWVEGATNPNDPTVAPPVLNTLPSGFLHPAGVTITVGRAGGLRNLSVMRAGIPVQPTTYSNVMSNVMAWYAENGQISNVAVSGSSSGCSNLDKLQVGGGTGNFAWVQITSVTGGAATAVSLLTPGAYSVFPASPAITTEPAGAPSGNTTCTVNPHITFTAGTPQSIGILMNANSRLEDVFVTGFNVGIRSAAQSTHMDHVFFDSANGIDISSNGGNGVYRDVSGGAIWSASAAGHYGPAIITSIASGGSSNQGGDVLNISAGTCTPVPLVTPQVTVDSVDGGGAITAAHISNYGDCSATPTANPATLTNLHSGTPATLNLQWTGEDFRPGLAFNIHDACDGCMFQDLNAHGWPTGFRVSNLGIMYVMSLILEPASTGNGTSTTGPTLPSGTTTGILAENCPAVTIFRPHIGGFQTAAALNDTGQVHATIPGYGCAKSGSVDAGAFNVAIFGGEIGSSSPNASYGFNIGPFSRGIINGVQLGAGLNTPVNVGANVYGWALRDMQPISGEETHWLTMASSAFGFVQANAIPPSGSNTTTVPLSVGVALPTSAPATDCTDWLNSGVLTRTTCP